MIAATHSGKLAVLTGVVVVGGTTVVTGGGVVVVGMVVVVGAAKTRRPISTRVGMFSARHQPVTGQRKTPEIPSAQSNLMPDNISVVFDLQPREVATETMRVRSVGFSEVVFEHKRGAAFVADHLSLVPTHVLFDASRETVLLVPMQTRIESTGDGAALAADTAPMIARGNTRATDSRRNVRRLEPRLNICSVLQVSTFNPRGDRNSLRSS